MLLRSFGAVVEFNQTRGVTALGFAKVGDFVTKNPSGASRNSPEGGGDKGKLMGGN